MNFSHVDPARLRQFLAVLEGGSYAQAAQRTGLSQPAISKGIQALERALGVTLFERGRAGARPTPHAERLAPHARAILSEFALAQAELDAFDRAQTPHLALGASPSLAQGLLARTIARFRRRWPQVAISVEVGLSESLLDTLAEGTLDLVVSAPETAPQPDPRLTARPLGQESDALVVRAGHPLTRLVHVGLADLAAYPWIIPRRSARLDMIHAVFARAQLAPPGYTLRAESSDLARGLLRADDFVCLIGAEVLAHDIAAGALVRLGASALVTQRQALAFTRRSVAASMPLRNFTKLLAEEARR